MPKKKFNSIEKLKGLIDSLTATEKRFFKRYVKAGKSGEEKYLQLFDTIRSSRKLSVTDLADQYFGGTTSKLYATGRYLEQLIFESLAFYRAGGSSGMEVAKIAIEKGYLNFGRKVLKEEMLKASKKGSLHYVVQLWDLVQSLQRVYGIEFDAVELENDALVIEKKKALYELEKQIRMKRLYHQMKPILKGTSEEKTLAFHSLEPSIVGLEIDSTIIRSVFLKKKLLVRWLSLGNRFGEASNHQFDLAKLIESYPQDFSFEEKLEVRSTSISFWIYREDFQEAKLELFRLGAIETTSNSSEDVLVGEWTRKALFISVGGGFPEIGNRAIKELESSGFLGKLQSRTKVTLFFQSAILTFIQGNHAETLTWIDRITKYSNEIWKDISWVMVTLKVISLASIGLLSEANQLLRNQPFKDSNYLSTLHQILVDWVAANQEEAHSFDFSTVISRINQSLMTETDRFYTTMFDIRIWLRSKESSIPMWQVIQSGNGMIHRAKSV